MPTDRADLDRFDLAILRVLQTEGRISSVELARRIGLSKSPTQARMKRLEEAGVITGYRATVDLGALGYGIRALIRVGQETYPFLQYNTEGKDAYADRTRKPWRDYHGDWLFDEAKGKLKQVAGKETDNPKLEAKGVAEKLAGKAERKLGEIKKVAGA